ncbi:MAG: zinc-binding dehydrogenase [Promethearchaeota archaeon]
MKALRFHASIPRYITTKFLGKINKSAYLSFFPPTKLDEIPEPVVRKGWVKVKPIYAGICGSDVNTVILQESPLLEPLCSFPAVLGHENVGIIQEIGSDVTNINIGDRVVLDPILSCATRGIEPVCHNCKHGDTVLCENFDRGDISPAFDIGWCRDTGGAFSQYYLAHESQIHKIPENVNNENAVLVEPFTIGIHAVLRHFPNSDNETIIVIGTGVIGLMVIMALRALGSKAKIIAIDKNEYQGKLALEKAGADSFIQAQKGYYQKIAKQFNARLYKPILEKKELIVGGGADIVFECVGVPSTIEDALRFTKSGGRMILIGNPHKINVDWSLIWSRELQVIGSFGSTLEKEGTELKHAFEIALELMSSGQVDLSWMVTHKFGFPQDYKKGLKYSMNKGRYGVIKPIFSFNS